MAVMLVTGATGYLGRHLVAELHHRGHPVRAVARDRSRAEQPGNWDSPVLAGLVDGWAIGDISDDAFVADAASGVDFVVSAPGVRKQKADSWNIDYRANLKTLESAQRRGVDSSRGWLILLHQRHRR